MKMVNKIKIGKIYWYNKESGIGKIIDIDGKKYMFLKKDCEQNIEQQELVQFRAESIEGIFRAFFIKKLEINKIEDIDKYIDNKNNLKGKKYNK